VDHVKDICVCDRLVDEGAKVRKMAGDKGAGAFTKTVSGRPGRRFFRTAPLFSYFFFAPIRLNSILPRRVGRALKDAPPGKWGLI